MNKIVIFLFNETTQVTVDNRAKIYLSEQKLSEQTEDRKYEKLIVKNIENLGQYYKKRQTSERKKLKKQLKK